MPQLGVACHWVGVNAGELFRSPVLKTTGSEPLWSSSILVTEPKTQNDKETMECASCIRSWQAISYILSCMYLSLHNNSFLLYILVNRQTKTWDNRIGVSSWAWKQKSFWPWQQDGGNWPWAGWTQTKVSIQSTNGTLYLSNVDLDTINWPCNTIATYYSYFNLLPPKHFYLQTSLDPFMSLVLRFLALNINYAISDKWLYWCVDSVSSGTHMNPGNYH